MIRRELYRLVQDTQIHRKLLFNRITVLLVIIAIASTGISGHVAAYDGGRVSGTVVDEAGEPMEGLTIKMVNIPLQSGVTKTETTTTDAQGQFEFTGQDSLIHFRITILDGETELYSDTTHLYFKGQNVQLDFECTTGAASCDATARLSPGSAMESVYPLIP